MMDIQMGNWLGSDHNFMAELQVRMLDSKLLEYETMWSSIFAFPSTTSQAGEIKRMDKACVRLHR